MHSLYDFTPGFSNEPDVNLFYFKTFVFFLNLDFMGGPEGRVLNLFCCESWLCSNVDLFFKEVVIGLL